MHAPDCHFSLKASDYVPQGRRAVAEARRHTLEKYGGFVLYIESKDYERST